MRLKNNARNVSIRILVLMDDEFGLNLVEKKKETISETSGKQQKKKLEREEEKLKNHNRDLSMVKMKSMFAIGLAFTALLSLFNSM